MSSSILSFGNPLEKGFGKNFDLKTFVENFEVKDLVKDLDLKTFAFLSFLVIVLIFLKDLVPKSFGPYGRSLAVSAADTWQRNRDLMAFDVVGRNGRSLEPAIEVLDSLAEAVKKWEEPGEKVTTHRSF
ncbi:uncharacterized protein [Palaemon carinicauda]|uniref:uncharacterized protein n=1 Tax=Palaemon carinicauda TaxID=392227 RepID=UPI0035B5E3C8